jgi:hypothetical protein
MVIFAAALTYYAESYDVILRRYRPNLRVEGIQIFEESDLVFEKEFKAGRLDIEALSVRD